MDAEEAEIMSSAKAGNKEALLGFSGRGFLDDSIDAIQAAVRGDAPTAPKRNSKLSRVGWTPLTEQRSFWAS
jgi:hypothetical protein